LSKRMDDKIRRLRNQLQGINNDAESITLDLGIEKKEVLLLLIQRELVNLNNQVDEIRQHIDELEKNK